MDREKMGNIDVKAAFTKRFCARLKRLRKASGLSRDEFAERVAQAGPALFYRYKDGAKIPDSYTMSIISAAQIARYENGRSLPDAFALSVIAEIFGADLYDLIDDGRGRCSGIAGFISISDAAKSLGVSCRHVRRKCREGKLNGAVKKRRRWLIPVAEKEKIV